ncbi:protein disulfide oxidoreductase [Glaesserella sp.]|uniref:protein disulfide oxidoreductase n=1 Tax=Glaesserella sp. TaxID=2094731 RepID=UPI0035A083D8
MNKSGLFVRFSKNVLLFGSLFIILSVVVDWFRKPTSPIQFAEQVLFDIQKQPKIIAQISHNQPMLLYFWGSWCTFCKFTSPAIQQLTEQGVPILTVAIKSGTDQEVSDYLRENNYSFTTISDPMGEFAKSWDIQATPTILIIKDGKMINHTTGLTSYWGLRVRTELAKFSQ